MRLEYHRQKMIDKNLNVKHAFRRYDLAMSIIHVIANKSWKLDGIMKGS